MTAWLAVVLTQRAEKSNTIRLTNYVSKKSINVTYLMKSTDKRQEHGECEVSKKLFCFSIGTVNININGFVKGRNHDVENGVVVIVK
jgi:hypothetical protein